MDTPDTPETPAPVPEDPTARPVPPPAPPSAMADIPTAPIPTVETPTAPTPTVESPTAETTPAPPIALGPVAGGWVPPTAGPPSAPMAPQAPLPPPPPPPPTGGHGPGVGGGAWGPISTPYGLAWGPAPIAPVPTAPKRHPRLMALSAVVVAISVLAGVGVGYAVWRPAGTGATNAASNGGSQTFTFPGGSGSVTFPNNDGSSGSGNSGSGNSGSGSSGSTAVASKVDPALVDINVTLSYQQESAAGTGQVLTSSGLVLTNNHVIDEATTISAVDIGNGKTYSANVVGYDRTGDLALIQLHGASGLKTVSTADSSKVTVGENVVAIGNAGGVGGTPSAAAGQVTTLNQGITASDDDGGNSEQLTGLIEVNADVQPGDSGGPLVNSAGQVIGIDTAAAQNTFSASSGDGYAIPINTALAVARQIEAGRSSTAVHIGPTAFLGVGIAAGDSGLGTVAGAPVESVAAGSPADGAGLTVGDVITSVGGQTVSSPSDLSSIIATHSPGDSVQVQWTDTQGSSHTATVQLASGPAT